MEVQEVFVMFRGPMTEDCYRMCDVRSMHLEKTEDGVMRPHAIVKSPFGTAKMHGETYNAKFINEQWFVYLD